MTRASEAAGATVLQSLLLFLRLKLVSMAAGAGGVGVLALGQAHQNVFVGLSNLSSGNVFTRDISKVESDNEKARLLSLCSFMGVINGSVMGCVGAILWFVFSENPDHVAVWSVAILTSIVALANFNQTIYALRGLRHTGIILSLHFRIFIIASLIFAILYGLGVTAVWAFFMVIPAATLICIAFTKQCRDLYIGALRQYLLIELIAYLKNNKIAFLFIGSLVVTSAQLIYRWVVSEKFGLESLGYFQTAWMISSIIMVLNTNIMTSVYLPSLNTMDKYSQVRASVRQILSNFGFLISVVGVFVFFGEELIVILASKDLMPALQVLYMLFIADLFRCVVSTLGLLSFYKKDLIAFLGIDIIGAVFPVVILVSFEFSEIEYAVLWSYVSAAFLSLIFIVYRMITFEEA